MSNTERIYSYYNKIRNHSRWELPEAPGSVFNNTCKTVAQQFKVSMEEVREAVYNGYSVKHNITLEEAKEHFNQARSFREFAYGWREHGVAEYSKIGL